MWAAYKGRTKCLKLLLKAGADAEAVDQARVFRYMCLVFLECFNLSLGNALLTFNLKIFRVSNAANLALAAYLIYTHPFEQWDDSLRFYHMYHEQDGNTALIHAASHGREGCVRLLINSGVDRTIRNKVHSMCITVLICFIQAHRCMDSSLYCAICECIFAMAKHQTPAERIYGDDLCRSQSQFIMQTVATEYCRRHGFQVVGACTSRYDSAGTLQIQRY